MLGLVELLRDNEFDGKSIRISAVVGAASCRNAFVGSDGRSNTIGVRFIIVYKSLSGLRVISIKTSRNRFETNGICDFSLKKQNNNGIFSS
jgi:hypothetical protein|tara:strand:+ start:123 stop:395 length:273 start_codon:yes stop_codon:yes gene_type:complete